MHAKRQIERQRQQCTNRNSTVIGVFLEQGFIEIEQTKSYQSTAENEKFQVHLSQSTRSIRPPIGLDRGGSCC